MGPDLSEEILHHRDTSPFFRTEPGQFFLTEFLEADDIPEKWKKPFPARRRTRDLTRDNTLGVKRSFLSGWRHCRADASAFFRSAEAEDALANGRPYENAFKAGQVEVKTVSAPDAACYKLFAC